MLKYKTEKYAKIESQVNELLERLITFQELSAYAKISERLQEFLNKTDAECKYKKGKIF